MKFFFPYTTHLNFHRLILSSFSLLFYVAVNHVDVLIEANLTFLFLSKSNMCVYSYLYIRIVHCDNPNSFKNEVEEGCLPRRSTKLSISSLEPPLAKILFL